MLTVLLLQLQGYEKANATQDTMYQVRWGTDYLLKMIGSGTGTNADYLEIIYQVYLLPLLCIPQIQSVERSWKVCGRIPCTSHVVCQRHAVVSGSATVT